MSSEIEAMDVDEVAGNSEDKENIFNNNGLGMSPRATAERACEDLDASEMNMRLRLSCTPLVSPAPRKHFTGSAKTLFPESGDNEPLNQTVTINSVDVTMTEWSMGDHNSNLNSSIITENSKIRDKNETIILSQDLTIEDKCQDNNDATLICNNTYSCDSEIHTENMNLSAPASTPTKEVPNPSTSPIMRGLKSVLSMFRPSQSPISQTDNLDLVSPTSTINSQIQSTKTVLVSTPVCDSNDHRQNLDPASHLHNNQLNVDNLVFNEDLVNDLQWNDDSTIIFNKNKFPGRRLCTPSGSSLESQSRESIPSAETNSAADLNQNNVENFESEGKTDVVIEYMDISMNDSNVKFEMSSSRNDAILKAETEETKDTEFIKTIADKILDDVFDKAKTAVDKQFNSVKINKTVTPESTNDSLDQKNLDKRVTLDAELFYVYESKEQMRANHSETSTQNNAKSNETNDTIKTLEKSLLPEIIATTPENLKYIDKSAENKVITQNIANDNFYNKNEDFNSSNLNKPSENLEVLRVENNLYSEKLQQVNSICNKESFNDAEIAMSENKSPDISLAEPDKNNLDSLPIQNICESNFSKMENNIPVELNSSNLRINTNFNEIENPFASRPRVSSSPIRSTLFDNVDSNKVSPVTKQLTSQNMSFSHDLSETKEFKEIKTSILTNYTIAENILIKDNENQVENCESITNDSTSQECENMSLALASLVISAHGNGDTHNIDSHEQSDAYLSADSGRESEQQLDSEAEVIDNYFLMHTNNNEQRMCSNNEEVIDALSNKDYIKTTNVVETIDECNDNAFETKTQICSSPPLQLKNAKTTKELNDIENPFCTKNKLRLSPIPQNFVFNTESPFTGSPSYQHANSDNLETNVAVEEIAKDSLDCTYNDMTKMNPAKKSESNVDDNLVDVLKPKNINKCISMSHDLDKTVEDSENTFTANSEIETQDSISSQFIALDENCLLDNPFSPKRKLRMSPTLPEIEVKLEQCNYDITSTSEQEQADTKFLNTISENYKQSIVTPNKRINEPDCLSGSSSSSSERDVTIREVKTEDEDTLEGPDFVGLDETLDNPFGNKFSNRKFSPDIEEKFGESKNIPKVIMCSDITSEKCSTEDLTSEEEFMECVDEEFKPGELFINADTFDFLMNKNSSSRQDYGKESLFLKFDPLCANNKKSGIFALSEVNTKDLKDTYTDVNETIAEENMQTNQNFSTPDKLDATYTQKSFETPKNTFIKDAPACAFDKTYTQTLKDYPENDVSCSVSALPEKPMMAVMPAVNNEPVLNARSSPYTPTRSERRSTTFSSPAIAAIDRLISLSGNNSPTNQAYYTDVATSQETREVVMQLQEMLLVKETEVEHLRRDCNDLQNRLTDLQIQMKSLMEDNADRLKKIDDLKVKLEHKRFINYNLDMVIQEYERSIAAMVTENEQLKQKHQLERAELIKERDEQIEHLNSMEVSFNDLHTKYERAKQLILTFKANEEALRKTIDEFKENQQKMETNYDILKQQAVSKLNFANTEFEKLRRSHEAEVVKLTAQIKRKELHISSLEETVAQKTKENQDLTAICDELISKVS